MRLIVLTVMIVAVLAGTVYGQAGYIGLYSDPGATDCSIVDSPTVLSVYVVHKVGPPVTACQFKVEMGPGAYFSYIAFNSSLLWIGDPLTGTSVTYQSCKTSDVALGTMILLGQGNSLDCSWLEVVAHPNATTGQVEEVDCDMFPTFVPITGRRITVNPTVYCPCDGSAEPVIQDIDDVGNDQGRQVRISWNRSDYDEPGSAVEITGYAVYRRQDQNLAGEGQVGDRNDIDDLSRSAQLEGWDFVGTHPSRGDDINQMVVPTLCDSTASGGICWSTFMVSALTDDKYLFFDSDPASGYSVDNLAPQAPSGFSAAYNTGAGNHLTWVESAEEDFQYYNIYRGTTPGFTPGPANLVHSTIDTDWNDPDFDGWDVHYKLTTLDFSGNESEDSSPEVVTGADQSVPGATALMQNTPNPFNPTTTISFNTATAGHVTLSIFDASGKHVRTLVDENVSAGVQTAVWDGRDTAGTPVSSGVYFYRLTTKASSHTKKMVLLK